MENQGVEISKRSAVDRRRESYEPFFDCEWLKELQEVTRDLPDLARIFFNLAFSWRGASNTHYLPSQTIHLLGVLANTYNPYGKDFKEGFTTRLIEKISTRSFTNMKRKEVQKAAEWVCDEMDQEFTKEPLLMFEKQAFWNDYVKNQEVRFTIIASQRMCYGAIYYAYENFILQVYQLVAGAPDYWIKRAKEFRKDFTASFGSNICQYCWSDPDIWIAGLARNALVHNGGKLTDDLKKVNHGFLVEGDEIQITPKDTKALHDLLKPRVTKLVDEAASKLGGSNNNLPLKPSPQAL